MDVTRWQISPRIQWKIFSYLGLQDNARLSTVSKTFHSLQCAQVKHAIQCNRRNEIVLRDGELDERRIEALPADQQEYHQWYGLSIIWERRFNNQTPLVITIEVAVDTRRDPMTQEFEQARLQYIPHQQKLIICVDVQTLFAVEGAPCDPRALFAELERIPESKRRRLHVWRIKHYITCCKLLNKCLRSGTVLNLKLTGIQLDVFVKKMLWSRASVAALKDLLCLDFDHINEPEAIVNTFKETSSSTLHMVSLANLHYIHTFYFHDMWECLAVNCPHLFEAVFVFDFALSDRLAIPKKRASLLAHLDWDERFDTPMTRLKRLSLLDKSAQPSQMMAFDTSKRCHLRKQVLFRMMRCAPALETLWLGISLADDGNDAIYDQYREENSEEDQFFPAVYAKCSLAPRRHSDDDVSVASDSLVQRDTSVRNDARSDMSLPLLMDENVANESIASMSSDLDSATRRHMAHIEPPVRSASRRSSLDSESTTLSTRITRQLLSDLKSRSLWNRRPICPTLTHIGIVDGDFKWTSTTPQHFRHRNHRELSTSFPNLRTVTLPFSITKDDILVLVDFYLAKQVFECSSLEEIDLRLVGHAEYNDETGKVNDFGDGPRITPLIGYLERQSESDQTNRKGNLFACGNLEESLPANVSYANAFTPDSYRLANDNDHDGAAATSSLSSQAQNERLELEQAAPITTANPGGVSTMLIGRWRRRARIRRYRNRFTLRSFALQSAGRMSFGSLLRSLHCVPFHTFDMYSQFHNSLPAVRNMAQDAFELSALHRKRDGRKPTVIRVSNFHAKPCYSRRRFRRKIGKAISNFFGKEYIDVAAAMEAPSALLQDESSDSCEAEIQLENESTDNFDESVDHFYVPETSTDCTSLMFAPLNKKEIMARKRKSSSSTSASATATASDPADSKTQPIKQDIVSSSDNLDQY